MCGCFRFVPTMKPFRSSRAAWFPAVVLRRFRFRARVHPLCQRRNASNGHSQGTGGFSMAGAMAWRRTRSTRWTTMPMRRLVLTADYIQGAQVAFLTSPTGLSSPSMAIPTTPRTTLFGEWGQLTQVAAAATQTAANGRVYTFQNWSNQAAASQTVTVDPSMAASGYRLTANLMN